MKKENDKFIRTENNLWAKRLQRVTIFLLVFVMVFSLFAMEGTVAFAASVKAPTVQSVTANSATSITVKWKKVSGAKGYVVYQKKGSGDYKKIATVKGGSKVSYTKKSLSATTKYYYKIKAYKVVKGKNQYSGYSNAKYTYTKPATPTLSSAKAASSTSVKLTWKKVSKAKGYVVYQKSGSSYKKVATVSSGSKTTYTVKGLTKGKKYTFAIKAYIKDGSKTIYSAQSAAKSATPKHVHEYWDYVCSCGKVDKSNTYEYLKAWVIANGEVDGSFVSVYNSINGINYSLNYNANADHLYIGSSYDNQHNAADFVWTAVYLDDFSYILSVSQRNESIYRDYVEGYIEPQTFTERSPLKTSNYNTTDYSYNTLLSVARTNICDDLNWLDNFLYNNNLGITIADLGFESF